MRIVVPSQLHCHFLALSVSPGIPWLEFSKLCRMLILYIAFVPVFRPDLALASNTASCLVLKYAVAARLMVTPDTFSRAYYIAGT